ncbi:hypothetical protein BsWGS_20569 [Bradybaena similaris]
MESSAFEPTAELHDNEDKRMDSLARSDSGKEKSLSSVDFPDENEGNDLESRKEIDDSAHNITFDPLMTSNVNASASCERTASHDCAHPDSGIENSPVSQHFPFSNRFQNDSQEIISHDDMSLRKLQKDMFEGHSVADLTDVNEGRSEKCSLKRQSSIDIPPFYTLDSISFQNEQLLYEQYSIPRIQSPEMSLSSSTDSNGMCYVPGSTAPTPVFVNAAHTIQAHNGVSGYNGYTTNPHAVGIQNGFGQLLTSAPPEVVSLAFRGLSPQGMVPLRNLDNALKELASTKKELASTKEELALTKKKIYELESENNQMYKDYALLARKNTMIRENWQLQLQVYKQRLADLQYDVDCWKNRYSETKTQLETELQTKHELNSKHAADLEADRCELEVKDRTIEDLTKKCQALKFRNEGLESKVSKDALEDSRQLVGAVRIRPVATSMDETQVKRTN